MVKTKAAYKANMGDYVMGAPTFEVGWTYYSTSIKKLLHTAENQD